MLKKFKNYIKDEYAVRGLPIKPGKFENKPNKAFKNKKQNATQYSE